MEPIDFIFFVIGIQENSDLAGCQMIAKYRNFASGLKISHSKVDCLN